MRRLVIANRGEIARRIVRAARGRGYRVAVISTAADAGAPVRREADEVLEVESFLDAGTILAAARAWGADLLHPGYGYLSENATFAGAVEAAGIGFVGPTAESMRVLGGKEGARRLAGELGVPTLPALLSTQLAALPPEAWPAALAERGIEPPYLVKASGGGGGKGMRVATDAAELPAAVARAGEEARAAFADGTVFVERYLPAPRHVEIQVFGDGRGGGVFWGERECSLQRRHQKLFEEAPSSVVTPARREAMGRAALALAQAAAYRGAGTVEFLLDAEGRFYFLEMNTRLQVEHPVTELVYGIDLVDAQLALAEGEWPLAFPAPDRFHLPEPRGQAFEARVLAEDPRAGFLPSPGTIRRYREPAGEGVRVDSGVEEGTRVTTAFDSLLAKVIVWGPDRSSALDRMVGALEELVIHGCGTNVPFLHAIALHPDVRAGRISTAWIGEHMEELCAPRVPPALDALVTSPGFAREVARELAGAPPEWSGPHVARFGAQPQVFPSFPAGRPLRLEVEAGAGDGVLTVRGEALAATLGGERPPCPACSPALRRLVAGTGRGQSPVATVVATRLSPVELAVSAWGETWVITDPRAAVATGGKPRPGALRAPMAGKVVEVLVTPGQAVAAGELLMVVESMKMQLEVRAPAAGVIMEVCVVPGQVLTGPDLLAVMG
ncbi:MAG TPA: biotin carboxylase N-terminal domain-containing protein [Thermoanaerobaculaceae bacterium]|nr:biotin carboxylase N-terminal domain-containing protein [Thermoanaerobaculaceae bacterium]HRS15245.1 biotin carboxylase N-terminal domain-containing protein [Thermoanaerobaculaceae bacterium]